MQTRRCALALSLALVTINACQCDGPVDVVTPAEGEGEGDVAGEGEGDDAGEGEGEGEGDAADTLYLQLDASLPAAFAARITALVTDASAGDAGVDVVVLGAEDAVPAEGRAIAVGNTSIRRAVVDDAEVDASGAEGYVLASGTAADSALDAIVVDGDGVRFGAYALLEELGFAFLHPLAPTLPESLPAAFPAVHTTSAPRWPVRNMHLHTMHPLELTDLLNGWAPPPALFDDVTGWEAMLPEWSLFLEWLTANGGNEVEWVLLESDSWADFAQSEERQRRLTVLVDTCHAFGVRCGIDVPIALAQQHTFRLVQNQGELVDELAQLDERTAYLMAAGFDFLSTENGTSEFTHADPQRTLDWMNELARTVDEDWGSSARIKIHTSTGQTADGFTDPVTGDPLNFNFLPEFADARLGVMPHTVQVYGLDDEAPTYGNSNFNAIRDFLRQEVGTRTVLWHPETAYWVSVDIDVPLFLPVYAERRLNDLRLLADDEDNGLMNNGGHMDGQSVFSSGWEWGNWVNDVVAMRSAWDPHMELDADAALRAELAPVARVLGDDVADEIAALAVDERQVLVRGVVDGVAPTTIVRRHGLAYLSGFEAYDDLGDAGTDLGLPAPVTQPDKLGLVEMRNPFHADPHYTGEADLLLTATDDMLASHADAFDALAGSGPLYADIKDALRVTSLRAKQVHGLYDYVDGRADDAVSLPRLQAARDALDEAQTIVDAREAQYRVPASRIASWREGPTAYEFGYLWTVHSLYFWWRDEGKAVDAPLSPCYLNIMNPADIAIGEGAISSGAELLRAVTDGGGLQDGAECLAPPASEPVFPQDDLRSRP